MDNKTIWNEAGLPGLILGLIPIACTALNQIKPDSFVLGVALWALKFGGCIFLMCFFMKRYDEAGKSGTFRFGVVVALLSAIVCSGCQLGYVLLIKPDAYQVALDAVLNSGMASALDSNSMAEIEAMMPKMPIIVFFCDLIYCFLFGLVVSAIVSGSIASDNPFDEE